MIFGESVRCPLREFQIFWLDCGNFYSAVISSFSWWEKLLIWGQQQHWFGFLKVDSYDTSATDSTFSSHKFSDFVWRIKKILPIPPTLPLQTKNISPSNTSCCLQTLDSFLLTTSAPQRLSKNYPKLTPKWTKIPAFPRKSSSVPLSLIKLSPETFCGNILWQQGASYLVLGLLSSARESDNVIESEYQ